MSAQEYSVTALRIATVTLCLLALPALFALAGIARGYLRTTADVTALRIDVVDLRSIVDPGRRFPGPDIDVRVYGVSQSTLRFAEVNFNLLWQGQVVAVVASFPNLTIPRNGSLLITVPSNLEPARAAETQALISAGERRFQVEGNARIGLPNSDASVWLTLYGQVRAAVPVDGGRWMVDGGSGAQFVSRQHPLRRQPAFVTREGV
jgi:hypothetical protein